MAHNVFISYSNVDKSAADAACAILEAAGIRCWIAPRNLSPGRDWSAAIIEAVDHCTVMVLIFSSNTNESRQVHREVEYAVSREKTVIPVRIESVQPSGSLAYHIVGVHRLDALTPPLEDHLGRLAASVKALLTAAGQEHVREGDQAVLDDMLAGKQTTTGSDRNETPAEQLGKRECGPRQQRSAGEHEARVRPREHRLSGGALAVLASIVAAGALLLMVALSGMFRAQTAGSISGRVDAGLSRTLIGHSSQVQSIAFSPDSRILVSASLDKTIRLWDGKRQHVADDQCRWGDLGRRIFA